MIAIFSIEITGTSSQTLFMSILNGDSRTGYYVAPTDLAPSSKY